MNNFLKLFLFIGIPVLIFFAWSFSQARDAPSLSVSIIYGFLTSLTMISFIFGIHIFNSWRIWRKYGKWGNFLESIHSKQIKTNLGLEQVFSRVLVILNKLPHLLIEKNEHLKRIVALKSSPVNGIYRERIQIDFISGSESTIVRISSAPNSKFCTMDNGKNLENVIVISNEILDDQSIEKKRNEKNQ